MKTYIAALLAVLTVGCATEPSVVSRPDIDTRDGACVRRCISEYNICQAGRCGEIFNACFKTCPLKQE